MLGYTLEDLNEMIDAVGFVCDATTTGKGMHMARNFLEGLWAEGYFD